MAAAGAAGSALDRIMTRYGDPKAGCLADEMNTTIQDVGGDLCSPLCHPSATPACPSGVPAGVSATPQCELTREDGGNGCVLVCSPTTDLASLRAGDAQCGLASCQPIQGVGVHLRRAAADAAAPHTVRGVRRDGVLRRRIQDAGLFGQVLVLLSVYVVRQHCDVVALHDRGQHHQFSS